MPTTTHSSTETLAAAQTACRELAGEIIGRGHSDREIAEEERLHALAKRLDPERMALVPMGVLQNAGATIDGLVDELAAEREDGEADDIVAGEQLARALYAASRGETVDWDEIR